MLARMSILKRLWLRRKKAQDGHLNEDPKNSLDQISRRSKSATSKPREPSKHLHDPEMQWAMAQSTRRAREAAQSPVDQAMHSLDSPGYKIGAIASLLETKTESFEEEQRRDLWILKNIKALVDQVGEIPKIEQWLVWADQRSDLERFIEARSDLHPEEATRLYYELIEREKKK